MDINFEESFKELDFDFFSKEESVDAEQDLTQPDGIAIKQKNEHFFRRLTSENQLENMVEWEFEKGFSYHFLSQGDVDSFSFLKFILRQQKIKYLITSTWHIAKADIKEFERYYDLGRLNNMDFYVGEIMPSAFEDKYSTLCGLARKCGGRVAVFRNHSKLFVGFGEKFDFVLESSANINTNPRCENTCITLNSELATYYKDFFDGIKSFNRNFDDWSLYELTINN